MKTFFCLSCLISFLTLRHSALSGEQVAYGEVVSTQEQIARVTVAIVTGPSPQRMESPCTGIILDSAHILTAAHCVSDSPEGYIIFAREHTFALFFPSAFKAPDLKERTFPFHIERMVYQKNGLDYAILSFKGKLPQNYEPAHFLNKKQLAQIAPKTGVEVAGYGRNETGDFASTGTLRKAKLTLNALNLETTGQSELTIIDEDNPSRPAEGDSGGPTYVIRDGILYVIGVSSYLHPLDEVGEKFSVFMTLVFQEMFQKPAVH